MKTSHLIRIALPGALAAALLASQVSQAADLVPPPGYYAAVGERKGSAGSCPAVPPPYTGSLVFTSKYEGSDSARATLNVKAEKTFRSQIKDITDMERGA
ncbi:alginate biosynthesis protein AlgL, partial [Pseudomonas aeruginosa]|nr:alginate biosynthesis protein AlgL [Pseudomonas aeruginosa]